MPVPVCQRARVREDREESHQVGQRSMRLILVIKLDLEIPLVEYTWSCLFDSLQAAQASASRSRVGCDLLGRRLGRLALDKPKVLGLVTVLSKLRAIFFALFVLQ